MSPYRKALEAMLAEWDRLDASTTLSSYGVKVELLVNEAQRQREQCMNARGYDPAPYLPSLNVWRG